MGRARRAVEVLAAGLSGLFALAVLALTLAPVALADTETPKTNAESNNLLFTIVALGVLSAVVILTRPRRGKKQ